MNHPSDHLDPSDKAGDRTCTRRHRLLRGGVVLGLLLGLMVLFYALENYRGERAWQKYKQSLLAQGHRFDPDAFKLPSVPDEQNFLKAPMVKDWFPFYGQKPGTSRTERLITITRPGDIKLSGSWQEGRPTDLKEWRDYFRKKVTESYPIDVSTPFANEESDMVPMIVIDDVPLVDALRNLIRQTEVEIVLDPELFEWRNEGKPFLETSISVRFENVTVGEALDAVLHNYGMVLVETVPTGHYQIRWALASGPVWPHEAVDLATLTLAPGADEPLPVILMDEVSALDAVRNMARQVGLNFQFDSEVLESSFPSSYSVHLTNVTPRACLSHVLDGLGLVLKRWENYDAFIILPEHRVMPVRHDHSAVTILESFNAYDAEFKALYAACQRPQARVDVDCSQLIRAQAAVFNFVGYRKVAQALALHASAQLALSNSAVALQDATVIYRLADSLKGQPNLVAAMTQVALAGLYLQVVWEGLAVGRWDDAQLQNLDRQLVSLDLLTDCFIAFEGYQAQLNWWLDQTPPHELAGQFVEEWTGYQQLRLSKPKWAAPVEWAIRWGPRGWIRQAQIGYTEQLQEHLRHFDFGKQRIIPNYRLGATGFRGGLMHILNPVSALVHRYGLNHVKAVQVTTRQQSGINQARIGCALERYRFVHDGYPAELSPLEGRFMDRIPHDLMNGDPFKYRRLEDGLYVLYSVGWDGEDDMAGSADWVWRYPQASR